jgi:murein L,D-transpeptidase YafK
MKNLFIKTLYSCITLIFISTAAFSQNSYVSFSKSSYKVSDIFNRKEDTLRKQFEAKGVRWPAKYVYIRSFKYDAQLELWAKNDAKDQYKLIKTYRVCMQSGTMGPKRLQGDFQVPEGFYYINEFNANSTYHLSLGLNYPNASDRILSDSIRPGGDIYIHGDCVSTGCIPVNNEQIEELFVVTSASKSMGLDFIPVHVFPVKYNVKKSAEYLANSTRSNKALQQFVNQLRDAFDHFEEKKQLPVIMVNRRGQYLVMK